MEMEKRGSEMFLLLEAPTCGGWIKKMLGCFLSFDRAREIMSKEPPPLSLSKMILYK